MCDEASIPHLPRPAQAPCRAGLDSREHSWYNIIVRYPLGVYCSSQQRFGGSVMELLIAASLLALLFAIVFMFKGGGS